jgi:hypothetical protein
MAYYGVKQLGFVPLSINGPSQNQLLDVLLDAFADQLELNLLLNELDERPGRYAANGYRTTIHSVIQAARAQGWDGNLILAARAMRPGNPALQAFAAKFFKPEVTLIRGAGAVEAIDLAKPAEAGVLERVVKDRLGFLAMDAFLSAYTRISRRVCKIEITLARSDQAGTGFLVGPRAVLTNYHVVEDLVKANGNAGAVRCRFDFRGGQAGSSVVKSLSRESAFPAAWAPPSLVDSKPDAGTSPGIAELDYALLELDADVGLETILDDGTKRGYLEIKDAPDATTRPDWYAADAPLVIVQHPDGGEMSVAIDTSGVIGLNQNGTRLQYRTNTEKGSSGSPCCTMNLAPFALHHAGDPRYALRYKPKYNQGVPLHRITNHIQQYFPGAAALLG